MPRAARPAAVGTPAMNLVEMAIGDLTPAPYNPRKHLRPGDADYEKLKRSLTEFGMVDPVIFNTRTKHVVGGHQRLMVLRDLGHATVPTVLVDLDEGREKVLNVALNKISGEWNMASLKDLLLDLAQRGLDQTVTGFDPKEIEEIVERYRDDDPGEDAPVPEPPVDPITRLGDLYELGPHRLVCGDSREGATWHALMGKELAHCMWTDPPYGIDLQVRDSRAGSHGKKGRDWTTGTDAFKGDKLADIRPLLNAVFPHVNAHLIPGGPWYIAGPHGGVQHEIFIEAVLAVGWHHAQTLVWVKNAFVPGRHDYHSQHEAILYGWKTGAAHYWDRSSADRATVIDDQPDPKTLTRDKLIALVKQLRAGQGTDVIREPKPHHNDLHPTMKPIPLIRRMLANSSEPKQLVLEPFGGSGSTLIAAAQMGRRARVIELEPRFCDVIVQRWQNLTNETARRIPANGAAA